MRHIPPPERFKLKMTEPPESDVQAGVLRALALHPKVARAWRTNTAAGKLQFPDGSTSRWMKFGFPGQPDICGFMKDGTALFIEAKRASGRVRPAQAEFIAQAKAAGCVAMIVRSSAEIWDAL